jgi:FtsP/CotA-like multicopper oxidase with cupredoxin domain
MPRIGEKHGRVFDLDAIAEDEYLPVEQLEVWEFVNQTPIAHPMHIHNVQFNIIARQPYSSGDANYQTALQGLVDNGWKDTVLVMPGERVRLLVKFLTYSGMYVSLPYPRARGHGHDAQPDGRR